MPEPKGGVCVECGDHFWSTHENACFCSEDCRLSYVGPLDEYRGQ